MLTQHDMATEQLEVHIHPAYGRYYVLKQDAKAGHLLLDEVAFAVVQDHESANIVCSYCISPPTLPIAAPADRPLLKIRCSLRGCSHVAYCSETCADNDISSHKIICDFWAARPDIEKAYVGLDEYRKNYTNLLIKCLVKYKTNALSVNNFWDCCDNFDAWKLPTLERLLEPTKILDTFVNHIGFGLPVVPPKTSALISTIAKGCTPGFESCFLLICKEECNSFGLYTFNYLGLDVPRQSFGLGFFPYALFFNHSCNPNVIRAQNGINMQFRAAKDLLKGDICTISYIPEPHLSATQRRTMLHDIFYFDCACEVCSKIE